MTVSFYRQLTAIILLVTVFFAPLNSIAHDYKSGAMKATAACQMTQDECTHDGNEQTDNCPCDGSGECCDTEEICHDAMEQPHNSLLYISQSPMQLFRQEPAQIFPKVYLAIFVPPES